MTKYKEVIGINPVDSNALISAGCRYLNASSYPDVKILASIIGLELVDIPENIPENISENISENMTDEIDLYEYDDDDDDDWEI